MKPVVDQDTGEIKTAFIRTPFNYDMDQASLETGIVNLEPSLTQQQFADECDINTIVKRFGLTGQLPDNPRLPTYGDFTGVTDFQTALNAVRAAEEDFLALPGAIRAEFDNDPQKLLRAVEDPEQQAKLIRLGLATAKPPVVAPDAPPRPDPEPPKAKAASKAPDAS